MACLVLVGEQIWPCCCFFFLLAPYALALALAILPTRRSESLQSPCTYQFCCTRGPNPRSKPTWSATCRSSEAGPSALGGSGLSFLTPPSGLNGGGGSPPGQPPAWPAWLPGQGLYLWLQSCQPDAAAPLLSGPVPAWPAWPPAPHCAERRPEQQVRRDKTEWSAAVSRKLW